MRPAALLITRTLIVMDQKYTAMWIVMPTTFRVVIRIVATNLRHQVHAITMTMDVLVERTTKRRATSTK